MAHLTDRGFTLKVTNTLLLIAVIVLASIPAGFASTGTTRADTITVRTVPLTIKVLLIGFDPKTIDQDYLTWKGNLIQNSVNNVLSTNNITGVTYNITYEFVYSQPGFENNLVSFLKSIQQRKLVYNPWFKATTNNYFYDAQKVENWFVANNASYGGFPTSGYTFVFANLTSVPSITESQLETENPMSATPHYYTTQYADKDLDYKIRYRDFTVGWGGGNRLWYLDLAAGPEFWTWTAPESVPHIPMQLAIDLYRLDVRSSYGKQWLTQFLSDYLSTAVMNLAVPVFTYQPVYSQRYRLVYNIIDNRTEKEKAIMPIESTFHPELVKQAFSDLLPYSEIQVETHFLSAQQVPGLQAALIESTVTPPSDLGIGRYVDARPVYRYLQEHLSDYVGTVRTDSTEVTVPVFMFAFNAGIYFGYTYEWYVATMKVDDLGNFLGESLGDLVLIGLTQSDFHRGDFVSPPQPGTGIGFTQAAIHEAGHSVGLMHPHQFGYLEDFESSAMSYWSWEYQFSQFDKDSINRAHANQLINTALSALAEAKGAMNGKFDLGSSDASIASARTLLDRALEKYDSMHYVLAVELAAQAAQAATIALGSAQSAPGWIVTVLAAFVLGIALGSSLIFIALDKYARGASQGR